MRVQEIWKFIHPRVSYSPQALPSGNMILLGGFQGGGILFLFHGIWFLSCVITCSDFYPLSNQINLFMVINIWGIITTVTMLLWMWFLNVWDNVPMDLKYVCQQYFTCMCFLDFIRYNKTFIACGKNHIHNNIVTVAGKWCVPSASDVFLLKNYNSGGKICEASEGATSIIFPSGVALREYDTLGWINFHISWTRML
jgi:hypothetical protein